MKMKNTSHLYTMLPTVKTTSLFLFLLYCLPFCNWVNNSLGVGIGDFHWYLIISPVFSSWDFQFPDTWFSLKFPSFSQFFTCAHGLSLQTLTFAFLTSYLEYSTWIPYLNFSSFHLSFLSYWNIVEIQYYVSFRVQYSDSFKYIMDDHHNKSSNHLLPQNTIIVPLAIFPMPYRTSPWLIYFITRSLYLLIPFIYFHLFSPTPPLATIIFFISLFWFCFLESTYEWNHMVTVFELFHLA